MNQQYWKFLRFCWKGEVYEFKTLPFRLAMAPITFTKLLHPVAASLRSQGIRLLIYLDDILVAAQTSTLAVQQMSLTISLLESLGFVLNWKKCVLNPEQNLEFLGFQVNTVSMTLSLPTEKLKKIRTECCHWLWTQGITPRQLAHLIGLMTSSALAILSAPLHYRGLQMLRRSRALARSHQNYDSSIPWTQEALQDLEWWIEQMSDCNGRLILPIQADVFLESDASKQGWGAYCRNTEERTGGSWTLREKQDHINILELQAAFLTIQTFLKFRRNVHVLIYLDNTVAVQYINRMGGTHCAVCHCNCGSGA